MDNQPTKYRYERKYVVSKFEQFSIIKELLRNKFLEIYSPRKINNVYFEDLNLTAFDDNIEGYSERIKIRVRWYGNTYELSNKKLEFKIKKEALNYKEGFNLGNFKLTNPIKNNNFKRYCQSIKNDFVSKNILNKYPIVFNSYYRSYFMDEFRDIRVTIDKNLIFNSFISDNSKTEDDIIIEFKYNSSNHFVNNLEKGLNISKYSKYVSGIQSDIQQ